MNLNIELLQTKCSDFMFNLPKVYMDNACYINVSSVGVFFSKEFYESIKVLNREVKFQNA